MLLAASLFASSLIGEDALAQTARPEKVTRAILSIERGCPITPAPTEAEIDARPTRLGPIVGALVAGIAGNLVTSGLNAVGNALESASQEKAFVAEGLGSFTAYRVENDGRPQSRWSAKPNLEVEVLKDGAPGPITGGANSVIAARCLVLIVPAASAAPGKPSGTVLSASAIGTEFAASGVNATQAGNAETRLKALGLTHLPSLYIEAELIGAADGMFVQPVLIRYAVPLPGAPTKTSATEMHVTFAVPGAADTTDIGAVYALARIPLPKMAPGTVKKGITSATILARASLAPYASVVVPLRATTGTVETALTARNAVVAAIETNKASQAQLKEAQRIAQRNLDQNKDATKTVELTNARDDAKLSYDEAVSEGAKLIMQAKADTLFSGSTNVKARFVVIRDANEFGLALAKALKAQAEATGTAVTEKLKPKPEWTTEDTAFVDAQTAVRAAERAVDDAIAAGKTSDVPGLQDTLTKAKAKANEAAVAAGRDPPYSINL